MGYVPASNFLIRQGNLSPSEEEEILGRVIRFFSSGFEKMTLGTFQGFIETVGFRENHEVLAKSLTFCQTDNYFHQGFYCELFENKEAWEKGGSVAWGISRKQKPLLIDVMKGQVDFWYDIREVELAILLEVKGFRFYHSLVAMSNWTACQIDRLEKRLCLAREREEAIKSELAIVRVAIG